MGHVRTSNKVHAALINRIGINTTVSQLAEATGLTEAQVDRAMYSLIKRDGQPITVVVPQQVWRLNGVETSTPQGARAVRAAKRELLGDDIQPIPVNQALANLAQATQPQAEASPAPTASVVADAVALGGGMYERVGQTSDGTVIVRDSEGVLYKVVAI